MASSDIIKIGFDYRSSLEQFEKDTNGVFDGISEKAGKQKISIQLDAKDDKVIDKIKELQKLKLDKFTFEFGDSELKEQLQTFDKLENKINEIISLSKNNLSSAFKEIKKAASLDGLSYNADGYNDELKRVTSSIVDMNKKGQESTKEYFIEVQKLLNLYEIFRKKAEDSGLFYKNTPQVNKFGAFIKNSQLMNDLDPVKDTTSDIFNGCLTIINNFVDNSTKKFISLRDAIEKVITISDGLKSINDNTVDNIPISNDSQIEELKSDIEEVKTELIDVKEKISSIDTESFENVRKDVEKTKESVKELNNELTEIKSGLSSTSQIESNISLGDTKEQSTEIDLYHDLEKRKVTYDEIINKIQTIISLKEKEKALSKTSDDTKLYDSLYDENDINWAGDVEGTINRISDRLKEIYTKYNGKISLINENDIKEAAYLLDILKGAGETPVLNKSQEKFYRNNRFSNDSLFENLHIDSGKEDAINKINTELSETYRWFNKLEGVSINEDISNAIKVLISDMQSGSKTANEYANDLLKIFDINIEADSINNHQEKIQEELKTTESQAEKTAQAVKEVSSTTSQDRMKDAIQIDNQEDIKSEAAAMEQVEKATDKAVQAKKDFATANEDIQDSVADSKSPLQLEAELMEQIAKSAREAADAKKEFVEANKLVEKSADDSNSDLKNGHSENAEPANVRKYKRKDNADPAKDTGNHDNEVVVNNKKELGKVLKQLQSEIIASIDESTSFVKEVTDFYDSQDNLVKTQMKISDNNGSMRTYTTSYSKDRDGNTIAWTSHIETQKIAEQAKREAKEQLEIDKQLAKEQENLTKAQQKKAQAFLKEQTNYEEEQKKAEFIKKQTAAYEELTNTISEYSEVAKRVTSGKAEDGDLELMTKLEDKISQLQKQPVLSDSQVAKSEKMLVSLYDQLDKIERKLVETNQKSQDKLLNGYDKRLDSYNKKITGYDATIKRFENGGWTSDTYKKRVGAVKEAVKQYETILNNLKNHPELVSDEELGNLDKQEKLIKENITAVQNMSAAEKGYSLVSGQKELDKINNILKEHSGMSREAKNQIKAYYAEIKSGNPSASLDIIHGKIMEIVNAEVEAGRGGKSMWDAIKEKAWYGVASTIGTYFGINDFFRYVKDGIQVVREFDTALTEMRKVSNDSITTLKNYQKETFAVANAVGTTALQIQQSTADWQRLGYTLKESASLAKNSNIYASVGDMDIDTATEHMVSSVQAWKSEFSDVITASEAIADKYNKIGNEFAITSADIGSAMETSAAALKAGGNTLDEALGLLTAGNLIQQDADTTSSALKILSLRIRGRFMPPYKVIYMRYALA